MIRAALLIALAASASVASAQADISERHAVDPDILGTPQCRFRAIPQLLLTDNKPPVVKRAAYRVLPAEGGKQSRFALGAQSGERVSNWQGILADPQIVLDSPRHVAARATRATIVVDGREIDVAVAPHQDMVQSDPPEFTSTITLSPTSYNPGGLLAAIARGSNMIVRIHSGPALLSEWTFDVRTLRHVPAALKGAGWSCG
jgi:hypothetical protein